MSVVGQLAFDVYAFETKWPLNREKFIGRYQTYEEAKAVKKDLETREMVCHIVTTES